MDVVVSIPDPVAGNGAIPPKRSVGMSSKTPRSSAIAPAGFRIDKLGKLWVSTTGRRRPSSKSAGSRSTTRSPIWRPTWRRWRRSCYHARERTRPFVGLPSAAAERSSGIDAMQTGNLDKSETSTFRRTSRSTQVPRQKPAGIRSCGLIRMLCDNLFYFPTKSW
jgi:hypothetical protein